MKVVVLSSGSKGNSTYVETSKNKILIDAGKNYKYLKERLSEIDVDIDDINYILVSHEHSDHTSSLKTFASKHKVTIVTTPRMLLEMNDIKDYDHILAYEGDYELDGIKITSIHSSHDAVDPRNFIIDDNGITLAYITDTGYINNRYFKMLSNINIYLFESNHDIEMLQNGPYPRWLKSRMTSDEGHLSNNKAGFYLSKFIGPNTKKVILTHLSETNNLDELALDTVRKTLKEYNIEFDSISCAHQNEISEVVTL